MKTVVVTGSTRGIGRGLAENFLARGCNLVVTGRNQGAVRQLVAELAGRSSAGGVAGRACDITKYDDLQALWELACGEFRRVDIWVNNAGISIPRAPLWEVETTDLNAIVNTNLTGVLLACKVAMQGMKGQGGGQIWNMEGFGSDGMAQAGIAAYGATKRAINYLNKALRKDAAGTGIQVCTLSPGIVVTGLLTGDYEPDSEEWRRAKRLFNILADRVETVTPFLVDGVLKADRDGAKVAWLTRGKAIWRFLTAGFNKRDLFAEPPG